MSLQGQGPALLSGLLEEDQAPALPVAHHEGPSSLPVDIPATTSISRRATGSTPLADTSLNDSGCPDAAHAHASPLLPPDLSDTDITGQLPPHVLAAYQRGRMSGVSVQPA